jgi:hypothetical protein
MDTGARWDFFVSYTKKDRVWAEWIAWVLEEDGYRVLIQAWDFVPGSNWIEGMQAGVRDASRTVAVLSSAYLTSVYGGAEWQAAWAADPQGAGRRLLVARVEDCGRPGLLAGVVGFDLFGLGEAEAGVRLREMVSAAVTGRAKPAAPPAFPGGERAMPDEPRFPGTQQHVTAGRDVYAAGRDLTVIHKYGPDTPGAWEPGLADYTASRPAREPRVLQPAGIFRERQESLLPGFSAPLVGRDREMDALRDALVQGRSPRGARVVVIKGRPAWGRAAWRLKARVRSRPRWLPDEGRRSPWAPSLTFRWTSRRSWLPMTRI